MVTPETYFAWLYSQVLPESDMDSGHGTYRFVTDRMHQMKFKPLVVGDGNRAADGQELRAEYLTMMGLSTLIDRSSLFDIDASLFEMLVALCKRANFMAEIGEDVWFKHFLENLGLVSYKDQLVKPGDLFKINGILRKLNDRKYTRSGEGGLFPLYSVAYDQRKTELWYQMSAYINENQMVA